MAGREKIHRRSPEYHKAFELFMAGVSLDEIAEKHGIHRHTIMSWYQRNDWRGSRIELQRQIKQNTIEKLANAMSKTVSGSIYVANEAIRQVSITMKSLPEPPMTPEVEQHIETLCRMAKLAISIQRDAEPASSEIVIQNMMKELNDIKQSYRVDREELEQAGK